MIFPTARRFLFLIVGAATALAAPAAAPVEVGSARLDITPELPIWLSGYQNRPVETTRIETPLYARALAIGSDAQKPAVLITVELIGIGQQTSDFVAAALHRLHSIERARIAIAAVHTHAGPALADVLPFMFSRDIPAAESARIARYTERLRNQLVEVAAAALANRRPAQLSWSEGKVDFAVQRRVVVDGKWKNFGVVPEGPVDHALPVLRVNDPDGSLRAVFTSYACHCTTLVSGDNFVHSDWAGDAATRLERAHRGAVALVALGCGADANPNPRGAAAVSGHGEKLAREMMRLLAGPQKPLGPVSAASYRQIDLALDHAVTREELAPKVAPGTRPQIAYAATQHLARLDAGQAPPTRVPYPVQAWAFGDDLAMVFLAGEVVSEYSLRLRRELDAARLWVNAYANSLPAYIPSRRMFPEGGYEVDSSMDYYGWPTRLAEGTEDQIIRAVREVVPAKFHRK